MKIKNPARRFFSASGATPCDAKPGRSQSKLSQFAKVLTVTAISALLTAATARAGIFTWSAPAPITTADATLNLTGTIVGAAVFGNDSKLVVLGNGTTVDFKADGSVAQVIAGSSLGSAYGGFTNDTGNASFNAALTQFNYDNGPKTISLLNLVVGQQYSVQLFALDRRDANAAARVGNYQDPNDPANVSVDFQMGDNVYILGTFIAGAANVEIQQNLTNAGNGNINALVVRAIGTNVPPLITTQPQSATIYNGATVTFTAGALGTGPLSYQWQKTSFGGSLFTNVANGGTISGATSHALTISALVPNDEGDYQLVVTNSAGSATTSPVATLTVMPGTPVFLWSAPAPITTADSTLNQTGSIVGAAVFGPTPKIVVLTNGTSVDFKNDGSVATATGAGITTGAFSGNTGNADFNTILNQFNYDNGPKIISLNNLVIGEQYAVQLFALDNRLGGGGGATARLANFQDPFDANNISTTFAMGDNVYTIGTFTAANTTVDIQENLLTGNGGNINALVVRRLSGLPVAPQITSVPSSTTVVAGANVQFTVGAN
ncbi:MAG: immunoglobulin domain-containing protein, partial [Akkermansiaceae bacterium]|nr:immunoglobulin domain-containing protein [Verrucomicrobiales bacterium]